MSDSEDARRKILARRATFVAAALAGVTLACGKDTGPSPQPCLSIEPARDAEADDASGVDEPVPPTFPDGGQPMPCLKIAPQAIRGDAGQPLPHPCLSPKRPNEGSK
jgi:hypothetical protein